MDFTWGNGPSLSSGGGAAELNLLGDNLLIDLDDKTLQCLMGGPSTGFAACMNVLPGEAASGSGKRHLDGDCGEVGNEVGGEQDEEDNDNDSEEGTGTATARGGGGRASGRGKKARGPGTDAASVKAHREKARRERLNECFEELARLCDPSGKMTRTDRISIVQDAIRALGAVRVENNQLRQLNKFLEERVRHLETARAQGMYQQAMMVQQQQQMVMAQQQQQVQQVQALHLGDLEPGASAVAATAPAETDGGEIQPADGASSRSLDAALPESANQQQQQQAGAAAGPRASSLQQQQQQQQQQGMGLVPPGMMLVPMAAAGPAVLPAGGTAPYSHHPGYFSGMKGDSSMADRGTSLGPSGGSGSGMLYMGFAGDGTGTAGTAVPAGHGYPMPDGAQLVRHASNGDAASLAAAQQQQQQMAMAPQMLPANAPPMSWLPAPDISQDQKLRPPAA
ncbi:hypothetical protein D9Q98_009156 [Chlorella vulgaris]|uniref:BHLH domain-containing protein n=1 Tax=Chlorella vulgaris TaxID=3077 RepID=A0A9D4TQ96_CHLVU|nr:hypothetical protein D9Q98_009156 [Chlorella vulgaris]